MEERFKDWLSRKLASKGWNQTDLAAEIDIDSSVISRWLRGSQKPRPANAARLADAFDTPVETIYSLLGMPITGVDAPGPRLRPLTERVREAVAEILAEQPIAIPIHDQLVSAGAGQQILDYAYWEPARVAGRNITALRVHGESMEPDIHDGDVVFLDRDLSAKPGDVVVATMGDELLVKKLRRRGGKLYLSGRTGEIPFDDVQVEGVVVELNRSLR